MLKAFDAHESQTRLESFFGFSQRFAKIRSKRIAKAVSGITGKKNTDIMDVEIAPAAPPAKKGRKKKAEGKLIEAGGPGGEAGGAGSSRGEEEVAELDPEIGKSIEKAARTVGRGKGTRGRGQSAARGRGEKGTRGRGRGRGRAKAADVDGQADRDAEGGVLEQESAIEKGAVSEAAVPARRVRLSFSLDHLIVAVAGFLNHKGPGRTWYESTLFFVPDLYELEVLSCPSEKVDYIKVPCGRCPSIAAVQQVRCYSAMRK